MPSLDSLPWRSVTKMIHVDQDEVLISAFDTHWIKFVSPVIAMVTLVLFSFALFYVSYLYYPTGALHTATYFSGEIILIATCHWIFYKLMSEGLQDIIITNKRFIFLESRLWLQDSMHEIKMDRIRAVDVYKNGLLKNLFNYGSLWFDIGQSSVEFNTIKLVPHPHEKAGIITEYIKKT